jgi:hypothetical protein
MKILKPITVGEYTAQVSIEERGAHGILFTAAVGQTTWTGTMTIAARHDHTPEQMAKDVADFATRLAHEAAGREHARILRTSIMGEK